MLARVFKRAVGVLADRGNRGDFGVSSRLAEARELAAAGDAEGAERAFASILQLVPESPEALHGLGRLQGVRGELELAGQNLAKAVRLRPDFAEAWVDLGNVHHMSDRLGEAVSAYRQALAADETSALAWCNLGMCQQKRSELADASESFRRALDLNPRFGVALRHWVGIQTKLDWPEGAPELLERWAARAPDHAEAHAALGFMSLKHRFRPDEALVHFDRALALGLSNAELHGNRGIALQDLGRIDEALASYDEALYLEPENRAVRFHRALARLLVHDFENAWPDYELRLLGEDTPRRAFPFPPWDGSDLSGRTILVYAEQGLGDEIMFASCLPDVIARAGHCVIECHEKLAPIFRRSFPTATVHGGSQHDGLTGPSRLPPIDCRVPIGSLPLHFRRRLEDFPHHGGYLKADEARVSHWRRSLAALGPGLKVGIAWRGGTRQTRQSHRSIPLEALAPVLEVAGAHFVSLQYDECRDELTALEAARGLTVHHFPAAIADYDETAALFGALDLVISVCTAAVHLGGALGRPVWVMAPAGPEWRYGIGEGAMPWYPTCRVLRQAVPFAWEEVILRVRHELSAHLDEN
ncbi:tetratricopeptide repeat protein [Methylococcus geothermalis]|nr:tetratricopeptide repeat protein [Methylococcus geothermalis]